MKNLKSLILSLLVNIILVILIFTYKMNLNISTGIFYLFASICVFSINKD